MERSKMVREILGAMKDANRIPDDMARYLSRAPLDEVKRLHDYWCAPKHIL